MGPNGFPARRRLTFNGDGQPFPLSDPNKLGAMTIPDLSPQRTKYEVKSTHFLKPKILNCDPVDPSSYKMLEPKVMDRH